MSQNNKNLRIRITFDHELSNDDFELRISLVDAIESAGIGEVWDESMTEEGIEINVIPKSPKSAQEDLLTLLQSMRLLEFSELFEEELE